MAASKKSVNTTTAKKSVEKKGPGGKRPRAGRPADPNPKVQLSGRVPQWVSGWVVAEVEGGRAYSIAGLVGELIEEALSNRGVKAPK